MNRTLRELLRIKKCDPKKFSRFKSDNATGGKPRSSKSGKRSKRYADTLNLPQTSYPLSIKNGAAAQREMQIQKTAAFNSLYQWQRKQDWDKQFVLHDGPPYANGATHVGHVVNKVLKDITNRYRVFQRQKVHYVPGWDCHGMPIEIKAIVDDTGKAIDMSPLEIRAKAKSFADATLKEQRKSFQRWGIMADWKNIYKTSDPKYEAKQLEIFYEIFEKGYVYQDYMPVYWSPSSQTALAEAELEYDSYHTSKAVYVKFPIVPQVDQFPDELDYESPVYALIWTTTPWTLPFNQAICYNPKIKYAFVKDLSKGEIYLCEEEFVEKLVNLTNTSLKRLMVVKGFTLATMLYTNPLNNQQLPLLPSSHVSSAKGTGLVHTAPAHGHDDFNVAVKHNLPKDCHVDGRGVYVSGVVNSLLGKTVGVDADKAVISALGSYVLKVEDFVHSYPYDWRTKQPVIIKASKQWFIDLMAIRASALESLYKVKITPSQSEMGMLAELNSRPHWCVSRQRTWGVPIPVFYHKESGEPLITRETVNHLCALIRQHGSDCWWSLSMNELLPNDILAKLNKGQNSDYVKGRDILDIWFDSGVSWATVLEDVGNEADVYLEGVDQFKGWFQTSLLTSVAVNGKAPYRHILTHGFATDEEGKKMSKSLGNVINPQDVIDGGKGEKASPSYGADVLRWWVAHSHHHQNIMLGPSLLQQFQEDVFKIRKCVRYLLGNLYDFNPSTDLVPYSELRFVDQYMLYILYTTMKQIEESYENFTYNKVIQNLEKFTYTSLSSFYINHTRDRCYCDEATSKGRRSSQTTQFHILKGLTCAIAPVMPHMADEIYQYFPDQGQKNSDNDSIFKTGWFQADEVWNNTDVANKLQPIFDLKTIVMDEIGLEMPINFDLHIYSSPKLRKILQEIQPEAVSSSSSLCEIFQTSQVSILSTPPLVIPEDLILVQGTTYLRNNASSQTEEVDYKIMLSASTLQICERCRRYTAKSANTPCQRCLNVIAHEWCH